MTLADGYRENMMKTLGLQKLSVKGPEKACNAVSRSATLPLALRTDL
jgi:hypothetical protein